MKMNVYVSYLCHFPIRTSCKNCWFFAFIRVHESWANPAFSFHLSDPRRSTLSPGWNSSFSRRALSFSSMRYREQKSTSGTAGISENAVLSDVEASERGATVVGIVGAGAFIKFCCCCCNICSIISSTRVLVVVTGGAAGGETMAGRVVFWGAASAVDVSDWLVVFLGRIRVLWLKCVDWGSVSKVAASRA